MNDVEHESETIDNMKCSNIHKSMIKIADIKQEPQEIKGCVKDDEMKLLETIDTKDSPSNQIENYVDDKVAIQETIVSINDVKEEPQDIIDFVINEVPTSNLYLCCGTCYEEYEKFCSRCPMLSYILDKSIPFGTKDRAKKTVPKNILEIKESFQHLGVFSLETIPKGTKFGPFDGLYYAQSAAGCIWKLKGGKLVPTEKAEYSNWMQFVSCARDISDQNLIVIQYKGSLYYRSGREIKKGEELLVYYGEEQAKNLSDDAEIYYRPVMEEKKNEKVYACTICCIGFNSHIHLITHKAICPYAIKFGASFEEIVQCSFCTIYLGSREFLEYHMNYCCEKYIRKRRLLTTIVQADGNASKFGRKVNQNCFDTTAVQTDATAPEICNEAAKDCPDVSTVKSKIYKCPKCLFRTKYNHNLKQHLYVHDNIKGFEYKISKRPFRRNDFFGIDHYIHGKPLHCGICNKQYSSKENLKLHAKFEHNTVDEKIYSRPKSVFRKKYESSL